MNFTVASRTLPCRVIKLGGSLFQYEQLVPAFRDWHDAQQPAVNVLVAGGGGLTDAVRDLDERFTIETVTTHWLCVRLLDVTARIVHLLMPEAEFIDRSDELLQRLMGKQPALVVFSVEEFLQRFETSVDGNRLPTDWSTTSDSIAARLAQAIGAAELVLLKSATLEAGRDRITAAEHGYVDPFFPEASQNLPLVRCVNLRTLDEFLLAR